MDFVDASGQRVRRSAGTTDKAAAQELHDQLKAEAWRQSRLKESPARTWDEAALRWLDEKAYKASLKDDMQQLEWLHSFLSGMKLPDITAEVVCGILERKRKETSASTANHYLALIRAILRRAHKWGWLDSVPSFEPYPVKSERLRWLTQEEAARLLQELPQHLADMAEFSLLTGLRQSNVTGLEWAQVDMQRRCAWIHPDQAKARKPIPVSLNDQAIQVLRRQLGKHHRVVFTYKGQPVTQTNTKAWRKALKRAGIEDFTWHGLRHTWASWHVQAGTPLLVLQQMGGWASLDMVQRYAHLSADHVAQYAANVGVNGTKKTQAPLRLVSGTSQHIENMVGCEGIEPTTR
ncbi:tyrosine-type recombinase/integrase [Acidithiobacillus caldus]|uniref:tyrosine-type recombinase/integrase n=1 Tax=Acidithiobacillus caldus TaxID=33059 RepID=UPI003B968B0E